MPLLDVQVDILALIAANRSPDSYVAGGTLSGRSGPRFSEDIDLFHPGRDLCLASYERDRETLEGNGYEVLPETTPRPGFIRAVVRAPGGDAVRMDWAHESAFRFFPVQANDLTGWELHWADAATNKVLAAAGRDKPRDAFDVLHWHHNPLGLGALVWGAVGKDPGFSPDLLLDEMIRNARLSPKDVAKLSLERPVDPVELATRFRAACREARELVAKLPVETVGALFVDEAGEPIDPDPEDPSTMARPHFGCERGCWPSFPSPDDDPEP